MAGEGTRSSTPPDSGSRRHPASVVQYWRSRSAVGWSAPRQIKVRCSSPANVRGTP